MDQPYNPHLTNIINTPPPFRYGHLLSTNRNTTCSELQRAPEARSSSSTGSSASSLFNWNSPKSEGIPVARNIGLVELKWSEFLQSIFWAQSYPDIQRKIFWRMALMRQAIVDNGKNVCTWIMGMQILSSQLGLLPLIIWRTLLFCWVGMVTRMLAKPLSRILWMSSLFGNDWLS